MTAYTTIPSTSIDADSLADVALMTALRDNAIAIGEADSTAPDAAKFGKLIAFTKITATNATWTPNSKTKKIISMVVGGGSGATGASQTGSVYAGMPGRAGAVAMDVSTSVSGTYAATVGAGSAGVGYAADSTAGTASSFIGTGLSVTGGGGAIARYVAHDYQPVAQGIGDDGETGFAGVGGVGTLNTNGAAAASNTGAGGGAPVDTVATARTGGGGGSGIIYVWEYS